MKITPTTLSPSNAARGPHQIDQNKVASYSLAMKAGAKFPPVRVVDYGEGCLMIIDGHHRIAAARIEGIELQALVADGEEFEELDTMLSDWRRGRADDEIHWL